MAILVHSFLVRFCGCSPRRFRKFISPRFSLSTRFYLYLQKRKQDSRFSPFFHFTPGHQEHRRLHLILESVFRRDFRHQGLFLEGSLNQDLDTFIFSEEICTIEKKTKKKEASEHPKMFWPQRDESFSDLRALFLSLVKSATLANGQYSFFISRRPRTAFALQ